MNRLFSKKTYLKYEKILKISKHQGKTDQNHNQILFHICLDGYYPSNNSNNKKINIGMNVEKREPYSLLMGIQNGYRMVKPLWKTVQQFCRKLYIEPPYDPAI